jgi:hypothetical protein
MADTKEGWVPRMEGVMKLVLLVIGAVAVVMYGVLVIAYQAFYGVLGIQIEEVGRSKLDLLPEALSGPIAIVAYDFWSRLAALACGVVGIVAIVASEIAKRRRERDLVGSRPEGQRPRVRRVFKRLRRRRLMRLGAYLVAVTVAMALLVGFVHVGLLQTELASAKGKSVRLVGESLAGIEREGEVDLYLLDVVALPARVDWTAGTTVPTSLVANPDCLMFLGASEGHAVLYDVKAQAVIRFNADDAVLTVLPNIESDVIPASCRREDT